PVDRRRAARARLDRLADRERDVAEAVARGGSNADIAAELHMSVATVKSYVSRLLRELGLDNRVQIALLVRDAAD
ncbi:response regulator transcription factor, partial [Pseudonocardia sp. SID8383]